MRVVLDASVMVALILEEDVPSSNTSLFTAASGVLIMVPPLWFWEVANGSLNGTRRAGKDWDLILEQLRDLRRLTIHEDRGATANALGPTLALAYTRAITAYDAAYLEMAKRRALPLATLDDRLAAAARAEGVEVIGG